MKKVVLFCILLLAGSTGFAQDYAPLHGTGVRRYFTNATGYLRGIRVDSVVQENGYKRYVTFRTARGWKNSSELADSNGACWIGKNVRAYLNGDWHFPNAAGDTIVIKTGAKPGDTWIFHRDTSSIWTEAKVISLDTQTVFGVLDSVKKIQLTVKNGNVSLPAHPISGFQITLSKTMGFAQVPDLYLFPYKDLDFSSNTRDYWYRKLKPNNAGAITPVHLLFTHVSGWNLPEREMYDFQIGDVINGRNYSNSLPGRGTFIDTVTARQDYPGFTSYTHNSWSWKNTTNQNGTTFSVQHGTYTFQKSNRLSFDTLHLPEEYYGGCYTTLYCNSKDTGFCSSGLLVEQTASDGCGLYINGLIYQKHYKFKKGLGIVYYRYINGDGQQEEDDLYSYQKGGILCGSIGTIPSDVKRVSNAAAFRLYPQPAVDAVYLEAFRLYYPITIYIRNLQGQLLSTQQITTAGKSISTANLPAGLYLLSITDAGGNTGVQKLVIQN